MLYNDLPAGPAPCYCIRVIEAHLHLSSHNVSAIDAFRNAALCSLCGKDMQNEKHMPSTSSSCRQANFQLSAFQQSPGNSSRSAKTAPAH